MAEPATSNGNTPTMSIQIVFSPTEPIGLTSQVGDSTPFAATFSILL
jgi:hypothetical protein